MKALIICAYRDTSRAWHVKNEIIAITDNNRDHHSRIEFAEDTSCVFYAAAYSGRASTKYRRYHHHHHYDHYHEPTIITIARLTVINHATGMIRLNCCSHVSALDACRAGRCMVGKAMPSVGRRDAGG